MKNEVFVNKEFLMFIAKLYKNDKNRIYDTSLSTGSSILSFRNSIY